MATVNGTLASTIGYYNGGWRYTYTYYNMGNNAQGGCVVFTTPSFSGDATSVSITIYRNTSSSPNGIVYGFLTASQQDATYAYVITRSISNAVQQSTYGYEYNCTATASSSSQYIIFNYSGAVSPNTTYYFYTWVRSAYYYIRTMANWSVVITYSAYSPPTSVSISADSWTITEGNSISMNCSASGGYPSTYTYTWQQMNTGGISTTVGSSQTYSISSVNRSLNGYQYRCRATNSGGNKWSSYSTLTIYWLPTVNSSTPADASYSTDTSFILSFSISTDGNPNTYSYQWHKDSSSLSGETSNTLSIAANTLSPGEYTYYCSITNSAGTTNTRTATIIITSSGSIWVFTDGIWELGTPMIYTSGSWQSGDTYLYNQNTWNKGG